ncbi:unnamed protein product [Eretmochelys imbricata]
MECAWYLCVCSLLCAWPAAAGHPCSIDSKGWADCSGRSLLHTPDSLPGNITSLDLSFNSLAMPRSGTFLIHFPSLHALNLSHNIIPTLYPAVFSNLWALHLLDLSSCNISHLHPEAFQGLRNLDTLLLKNNKLQILRLPAFLAFRALVHLDLRNNDLLSVDALVLQLMERTQQVLLQGNPWVCNCSMYPFQQWQQQRRAITTAATTSSPAGKGGNSWPYLVGFLVAAVGISILIALAAKCKLFHMNFASYRHQPLPDTSSIGVAWGENQSMPSAAGLQLEDDDGFIEDNYIQPSEQLQEEDELEPHFSL